MGKGRVRTTLEEQEKLRQHYRTDPTQRHADLAEWAFSQFGKRPSAKTVAKILTRTTAPHARPDACMQYKDSHSGLYSENRDSDIDMGRGGSKMPANGGRDSELRGSAETAIADVDMDVGDDEDAAAAAGVLGESQSTAEEENQEKVAATCNQFPAPNELQVQKQLEEELALLKTMMKTQKEHHEQAISELKVKHDADMDTLRKEFDVIMDDVWQRMEEFRKPVREMKCFMETYIKAPRVAHLAARSVDTAALSPEPVKEPVPSANPNAEQRTSVQGFQQAKIVVITPPVNSERIARSGSPSTEKVSKPTSSKQLQRLQANLKMQQQRAEFKEAVSK